MPEEKKVPSTTPAQNPKPISGMVKRPKPMVEGINAPVSKAPMATSDSGLTDAEKTLINNPIVNSRPEEFKQAPSPKITLLPIEQSGQTSSRWWLWLLIILLLAAAGAVYYFWQARQNQNSALNNNLPITTHQTKTQADPNNASSTNNLGTTASTTASSTVKAAEIGKKPADLFTPPVAVTQVTINKTPTGYLNVRSQPATSASLVTKVNPGETYTYTSVKNGWYQITLKDGSSGWVLGTYVTVKK